MSLQLKTFIMSAIFVFSSCTGQDKQLKTKTNLTKEHSMKTNKTISNQGSGDNIVSLKLSDDLNTIKAGNKYKLIISPILVSNNKLIGLETIHERKAHIIIVSDDLGFFTHIHPIELNNNTYEFELNLISGGKYKMFIEYKPEGYNKATEEFDFIVSGDTRSLKTYDSQKTDFSDGEYSVKIVNANNLITGNDQSILVEFYKNNEMLDVNSFDNYLGEKAHAVLISVKNKYFLHIHPVVSGTGLNLHFNPVEEDYFRLWLQFSINNKIYTADFVLKSVTSGSKMQFNSNHKHH